MEVHHHSHHTSGETHAAGGHQKKWTHYFWEFFMLFLAVTLGFLVENQREHYVEGHRAKQYAKSLYEDIKLDTVQININIWEIKFVNQRINTFRNLVQNDYLKDLPGGTWYYFGRFGTRQFEIAFQDATLKQLISSGSLRYFKNSSVINAITYYDQSCRRLQSLLLNEGLIELELIKLRNSLFNTFYFDEVMSLHTPTDKVDSFKKRDLPLLSDKKEDFIQYANLCQMREYNNEFLHQNFMTVLNNAEKLLAILNKKYHFN